MEGSPPSLNRLREYSREPQLSGRRLVMAPAGRWPEVGRRGGPPVEAAGSVDGTDRRPHRASDNAHTAIARRLHPQRSAFVHGPLPDSLLADRAGGSPLWELSHHRGDSAGSLLVVNEPQILPLHPGHRQKTVENRCGPVCRC
jgi:hypothetical protein